MVNAELEKSSHLCRLDQLRCSWLIITGRDANLQEQKCRLYILKSFKSKSCNLVLVCVLYSYLDDHAHYGQSEDSSRMGRWPAVDVITSCC